MCKIKMYFGLKQLIYLSILTAFLSNKVWCGVGEICNSTETDITNCAENTTGYICINDTCACDKNYYNDDTNSTCESKSSFEGNCSDNGTCLENMTCINNQCGCDESFYHDNNSCLNKSSFEGNCFNGRCLGNMICIENNTCGCDVSFYHDNNICLNKSNFEENCSDNGTCLENMTCINNQCGCDESFYHDNNSCLNKPGYGENCISLPDNCNVNNGSCNGTTCICNDNFYTDVKQCKPVSGLQPTDFKVTTTNDSFAFDWKSPISVVITQFIISGDNSNGFKNITIDKNLTTATIRGLQQGTRYYNIKVAAIVNTDRGEVHVDSTNTINDTTKPGKAGDLSTSNIYDTTKTMKIEFTPPISGRVDYYSVNISGPGSVAISEDVNNTSITIVNNTLLPGRLYTINIRTHYNDKTGEVSTQGFHTNARGSDPVKNLTMTNITSRSLAISWSYPENDKGNLTAYILDITVNGVCEQKFIYVYNTVNKSSLPSNVSCSNISYIQHNLREHVNQNITDLQPYTNYTVTVIPYNSQVGEQEQQTYQTLTEAPGKVKNLEIQMIPGNYTAVDITWECPDERDRHGVITGYRLSYNATNITIGSNKECKYSVRVQVKPGATYTYKVQGNSSTDGLGDDSTEQFLAPIGKPIISKESNLVVMENSVNSEQSTLTINICSECLLDNTNGDVIFTALLVCISDYCKYNESSIDMLKNFDTWKTANEKSFKITYRVTEDNWHGNLAKDTRWTEFVVGDETGCENKPDVCNGPLKSNTKYRVIVIACTSEGCSDTGFQGLFMTKAPSQVGTIVAAVVVPLIVFAFIGGVAFWWIRRRKIKNKTPDDRASLHSIDSSPRSDTPRYRPIKLDNFEERLIILKRDSNLLFSEEFEGIAELSPKHPSVAAALEENKTKNRYVNILPFDHSRVKLLPIDDDDTTDYINANYIPGYKSQREYIAAQGPLEVTINDFWRMIWEQRVVIIVMLSDLQEKGKPKVDKYWMDQNEPAQYGEIDVELTNVSVLNKYTIKIFEMKLGDEVRKVRHFFLPGWEDYRANLQPADVLEFLSVVRQEVKPIDKGPMVVHCSAGVGRTGTFIALDIFQQYINDRDLNTEIDIYDLVLRMRNFRQSMVQSEKQYIFIHETVKEIILQKKRKLLENDSVIYENTGFENHGFVSDNDLYMNVENGKPTTVL